MLKWLGMEIIEISVLGSQELDKKTLACHFQEIRWLGVTDVFLVFLKTVITRHFLTTRLVACMYWLINGQLPSPGPV